jgi:hypothetical protein
MVVNPRPFSPAARLVAWILAAMCLMGGGLGLVLGIARGRPLMAVAAVCMLGLGVLYAGAPWRDRPWR